VELANSQIVLTDLKRDFTAVSLAGEPGDKLAWLWWTACAFGTWLVSWFLWWAIDWASSVLSGNGSTAVGSRSVHRDRPSFGGAQEGTPVYRVLTDNVGSEESSESVCSEESLRLGRAYDEDGNDRAVVALHDNCVFDSEDEEFLESLCD